MPVAGESVPRLFTGLETPPDVALRLSMTRGGLGGARWIDPADYHVTLSFVGEVDHGVARDLADELAHVAARPFDVRITALSAFGGDRPRAIVASVELTSALADLQADHERALRRVGIAPERRKYTPHVTLARLDGASSMAVAAFLGERALEPLAFTARRFLLYSARTSRGGGPYAVEAAYPLR